MLACSYVLSGLSSACGAQAALPLCALLSRRGEHVRANAVELLDGPEGEAAVGGDAEAGHVLAVLVRQGRVRSTPPHTQGLLVHRQEPGGVGRAASDEQGPARAGEV